MYCIHKVVACTLVRVFNSCDRCRIFNRRKKMNNNLLLFEIFMVFTVNIIIAVLAILILFFFFVFLLLRVSIHHQTQSNKGLTWKVCKICSSLAYSMNL